MPDCGRYVRRGANSWSSATTTRRSLPTIWQSQIKNSSLCPNWGWRVAAVSQSSKPRRRHGSVRTWLRWDAVIWEIWSNRLIGAPIAGELTQPAPIGAGMIIRREVLESWAALAKNDQKRQALGRKGAGLSSGEDNDINLVALTNGCEVAYFPELELTHLISERRLEMSYLKQLAYASSRDWQCVLALHEISPWPPIPRWTVPLRKLKAWFTCRAWAGPAERIRWAGACGHFDGRASIHQS